MTPRFAIVPVEATEEMLDGAVKGTRADISYADAELAWPGYIAASPSAGRIGAEALERAAEAYWCAALEQAGLAGRSGYTRDWKALHEATRILHIARMRAAFEAAGIGVEGGAE